MMVGVLAAFLLVFTLATPASAQVYASDAFQRANTTSTLNSLDDGRGRWFAPMSNLEISGNLAQCGSTQNCSAIGAHSVYVGYLMGNSAEYVVIQELTGTATDTTAILCRSQSTDFGTPGRDWYGFSNAGAATDWRLQNVTDGNITEEKTTTTPTHVSAPILTIKCEGHTVTAYQNLVSVMQQTFTTNLKPTGRGGVYDPVHAAGVDLVDSFAICAIFDDCFRFAQTERLPPPGGSLGQMDMGR